MKTDKRADEDNSVWRFIIQITVFLEGFVQVEESPLLFNFVTMNHCNDDVQVCNAVPEKIILNNQRKERRIQQQIPSHAIVLDYDDTIFPSTWFSQLCSYATCLTSEMARELKRVDERASMLIKYALEYSPVVIITNSEEGWVQESARLYLPCVYLLLERVTIISARSRYESVYPRACEKWKELTFDEELSQLIPQNCEHFSVLSIGDSLHEREAAFAFGKSNDNVIVKSIKMIECPSPSQLATEQELITNALKSMILSRESLDLKLSIQPSL